MTAATENPSAFRPCLVLAHSDDAYAARVARSFRRLGWDVYPARSGPEARRLTRLVGANRVLLDTDLPGESGWLTCAKLTQQLPGVRVVLVSPDRPPQGEQ